MPGVCYKLYQAAATAASLAAGPALLLHKRGRVGLKERYGVWNYKPGGLPVVWLHAASYGEVAALTPIVKALRERFAKHEILITTTSDTGLNRAKELADQAFFCPLDSEIWLKPVFKAVNPSMLIISETEIWPGLISSAVKHGVPVYIINGRISDYTFKRYTWLRTLLSPVLQQVTRVFAINNEARERYIALGARDEAVEAAGYSKYDTAFEEPYSSNITPDMFAVKAPVLTLGSIRPEEERLWFEVISTVRRNFGALNVIVAPRHSDKFGYFEEKLSAFNFGFTKYSQVQSASKISIQTDTLLLDSMGKLKDCYAVSDLSFVGASLVDIGGHNPLEPCAVGSAVCIGPYHSNVKDVVQHMNQAGAVYIVKNRDDALALLKILLMDIDRIRQSAANAKGILNLHRGVGQRIVQSLKAV